MPAAINRVGMVYGRLKVIRLERITNRGKMWECLCSCGNTKIVSGVDLHNGSTMSCGCLRRELFINILHETRSIAVERSVATRKGKKRTDESIQKQRESISGKKSHRYGVPAAHGKRFHAHIQNVDYVFRSSWELLFAEWLDENGFSFTYEKHHFPITFEIDGVVKHGTYCPDFRIEEYNLYIEVKGFWRDNAKVKFEAFRSQYPDVEIEVWGKEMLEEYGVI